MLVVIFDKDVQDETDDAHNQRAKKSGPKTGYGEADAKTGADLSGKIEEKCVDQQCAQSQGEDNKWTAHNMQNGFEDGVDQTKDQSQPEK